MSKASEVTESILESEGHMNSLMDKYSVSRKEAEDAWDRAKVEANKSYDKGDPKYWGTVVIITKNILGKEK